MRGKIFLLFLFILSMLAPIQVSAQKVKLHNFREARNYLKNNKKGEVDKIIKKLTPADSIEKKYLTGMINQYSIEQSNVNVYWGTKVDTANVFKMVYSMYDNYYASYPYIKDRSLYANPLIEAFRRYQSNLGIGGNYFVAHKDYDQAYKFYDIFLRLKDEQLISVPDTLLKRVYGNAVIAANQSNRYEDVVRLANEALASGYNTEDIDIQLCGVLRKMDRKEEWVSALKQSIKRHPEQFAFYGMLIDYYLQDNHADDAMVLADDLIQTDSTNYLNCFVKGYVCLHTHDLDNAQHWLEKSYAINSSYVPVLSSLGFCTIKQAEKIENSITHFPFTQEEKEEINGVYRKALEYLEKCRELAPKDKAQWADSLWKVYYKLNEGEKLDEIERLMD